MPRACASMRRSSRIPPLKQQADALAAEIDRVYAPRPLGEVLEANAKAFAAAPSLQATLRDARDALRGMASATNRYLVTANLLASLRDALPKVELAGRRGSACSTCRSPSRRRISARRPRSGQRPHRRRAARTFCSLPRAPRRLTGPARSTAAKARSCASRFARLAADEIPLGDYLRELRYLGLVPGWGTQGLRLHFSEAMEKLGEIEPLAELFIQDQLRGSPLLFYSQVLDDLSRDANRLAGAQHKLFGRDIGAGFNALNPGLARGVLHANPDMKRLEDFRPDGIYVLPESVADLPPLAGILTAGAGNPLSHVQLLARNLGIPNVAVDQSLLPAAAPERRQAHRARREPGGPGRDRRGRSAAGTPCSARRRRRTRTSMFEPDLKKLDLSARDFVSLDALRAKDSGRIVGPKAAKLGELKSHFPDRVAPGVGIPFGLYRATVLDRPYRNSGKTVYEWMVESFRKLEAMPAGSREAAEFAEKLRAEIYSTILKTDPGPQFRAQLRAAMAKEFGADFRGGVFVRSDTNVEDLPGFTGAGLNLTVFNVVGFDNIVKAISEVWASPYDAARVGVAAVAHERARARLSGGAAPEDGALGHFRRDDHAGCRHGRSGRAVRRRERRRRRRSGRAGGRVGPNRPEDAATRASWRRPPRPGGWCRRLRAGSRSFPFPEPKHCSRRTRPSSSSRSPTRSPKQFPQLGEDGKPVAADVEFAFVNGKLWLLQIRPFNESRAARGSSYLIQMDKALDRNLNKTVNMREVTR